MNLQECRLGLEISLEDKGWFGIQVNAWVIIRITNINDGIEPYIQCFERADPLEIIMFI